MAAKKSLLREGSIEELLLANYDLEVTEVEEFGKGMMSKGFKITVGNSRYFLKELLTDISTESIENEARLIQFMKSKGIPVAEFVKTLDGKWYAEHQDNLCYVQEFIEGDEYRLHTAPIELLSPSISLLGKINANLANYKIRERRRWSKEHSDRYCEQTVTRKLKRSLAEMDKLGMHSKESNQVREALKYLISVQARVKKYGSYFKYLSYSPTHGDYQVSNLIFEGDEVIAVVDCTSSGKMPVFYNLLQCYISFSKDTLVAESIDITDLIKVLHRYTAHAPLTYYDYKLMPYAYAHVLGRIVIPSKIRRYIAQSKVGNDDLAKRKVKGLLRAVRRYRYFMENADKMSGQLEEYYEQSLDKEELKQHRKWLKEQEHMKWIYRQERIARQRRMLRRIVPLRIRRAGKRILSSVRMRLYRTTK